LLKDGQVVLQESDAATGALLRHYTNGGSEWGNLLSLAQGDNTGGRFNLSRFNLCNFNQASGPPYALSRFFAFDQIGTTRLLLDAAGNVVDTSLYSGYGAELDASGSTDNRFGFDGNWNYFQLSSNLLLAGARIYDPATGTWLSLDPIGFEGGWNILNYVNSNPVNGVDPMGEQPLRYRLDPFAPRGRSPIVTSRPPLIGKGEKRSVVSQASCDSCGPDITESLEKLVSQIKRDFWGSSRSKRKSACWNIVNPFKNASSWDITDLIGYEISADGCGTGQCSKTAAVNGSCHDQGDINYIGYGVMNSLCFTAFSGSTWTKTKMARRVFNWKMLKETFRMNRPEEMLASMAWANNGYDGWPSNGRRIMDTRPDCLTNCQKKSTTTFDYNWKPVN
jgi:RHS repeat-associated protein